MILGAIGIYCGSAVVERNGMAMFYASGAATASVSSGYVRLI